MFRHASRRRGISASAILGLVVAPLAVLASPGIASANVAVKITTFPYSQSWANGGLITTNDDWSGVEGVQGYRGDDLITGAGVDPQTVLADGSVTPTNVIAQSAVTSLTGGIHEIDSQTIAMQGSGTADAPHVVFHLDLTGQTGVSFGFDAQDLDAGSDDAIQQVAVQYRVGSAGAYTNLPAGFISDATTAGTATQVTPSNVALPAAAENQASVFLRVVTTNAAGGDELVGIDNISIGARGSGTASLAAINPGSKTATTNQAITPFTLEAGGGTPPYSWTATGLPNGVTVAANGNVSGTPTAAGVSNVTATVTDSATPSAGTAQTAFTITVSNPAAAVSIAEIQGAGDTTPYANQVVTTTGVVTAAFPTGGLGGFYLQTGGPDTTPNASDGIFVYAPSVADLPVKGDTVTVSGTAKEFSVGYPENDTATTLTQIEVANASAISAATAQPPVVAKTVVPGTDCAEGLCLDRAGLLSARENVEGELFAPTGAYTTTDVYDGSPFPGTKFGNFGEIGLAAESSRALVQPTELYDTQTQAAEIAARTAYNDAHRIILDDGSATNFSTGADTSMPLPWLTADHYVRNNAAVTFPQPVVLTVGFDGATLLPSGGQVSGAPTGKVTFDQNRPIAPRAVNGDIKLATFNVLNYFPTTGEEFVSSGLGTCSYYTDRADNKITNRSCNPSGPRGAANAANLQRQQDKIVNAINGLDASIVSLEEIENSVKFGKDRDFAVSALVTALNADLGADTWDFAPSPPASGLPALSAQDVIRTAFIYKPAVVQTVGKSRVLSNDPAFTNARQPLAQGFRGSDQSRSEAFAVIVNHFKSKGSGGTGDNADSGQGAYNGDRTRQAMALKNFASDFSSSLGGNGAVFLTGDFNAYTEEDPVQVLTSGGYTQLESTSDPLEESYNFSGLDGSLDHVFANPAAAAMVTGVDIWNINGDESVYQEYSRFNYNITNLYSPLPYRASDHNPEVVGLSLGAASTAAVDVQVLATNDFHGRIANDPFSASAGAAVLAGAVKQLRAANPNTTFAAAGDLIGASTFESFVATDKPTIDALNEAGLDVSAVGNHEFDKGYDDLVNRVMAPYDARTNPDGGAKWKYLGANVKFKASGDPALKGTWMTNLDGVRVGYIGAVTEQLPSLVSPDGISQIAVTDIVAATNTAANSLEAAGADVIVLLVHEGAPTTDCAAISKLGANTDFGSIVKGVNDKVDAIVSGHTHLEYNCSFPVDGWSGRAVTERPVVSAGQYGTNLNKLVFTVDPTSGVVTAKTQSILKLKAGTSGSAFNYPVDPATKTIVDSAVANAEVLGAEPLGKIEAPFFRAKLANGTTENRGGESTLGNLVAEIQQDATEDPTFGSAQIAFMNPGGLRTDLVGQGTGAFPRTVTYKDAANVQPFANTLVNEDLTGAQIKAALEQQWQPAGSSRPFLKLAVSEGFTYTYNPAKADGSRITAMYLNGAPINLGTTYSVTVNSFLAAGGDNFSALNGSGRKQDTGRTDLQAQVDYFAEFASGASGLPVDYSQRAVGVDTDSTSYTAGDDVVLRLSSLSMTGPGDLNDTSVTVKLDGQVLGSFPVTTERQTALPGFDEVGTALAAVTLPSTVSGAKALVITGDQTGTRAVVPITVTAAPGGGGGGGGGGSTPVDIQVLATNDFHGRIADDPFSASAGAAVLAGAVKELRAANPNTTFAAAGDLIGASTFESFVDQDKPTIDALNEAGLDVSAVGNHEFDKGYDDLINRVIADYDATTNPKGGAEWKYIGANVKFKDSGDPALDPTFVVEQAGVTIGYVGAVTEQLPSLVSPDGISQIEVTDIVAATNAAADDLVDNEGADIVVLLVHEGAPTTDCAEIGNLGANTDFGSIVQGVNDNVDAIVSGHTHLAYNCSFPVDGWSGRAVTERPVVSAGQYGANLNQLVFTVDPASGVVQAKSQAILKLKAANGGPANYPVDPATKSIVDAAVANAEVLGAEPLGKIEAPFFRAKLADGTTENRGGESTLGNLVAEIQQDATEDETFGSAQIAFMNPGGLRADLLGTGTDYPRTVTFKQAANVQPFANTLVNQDLTGAEIKMVLEQQWQPEGSSRPFLKLGISEGFTYTYDPSKAQGERIQSMYLNGEPIDLTETYSVTANSFLTAGGDNFSALNGSGRKQDTGRTDLQAQVDYFAEFASDAPLPVDYSQRAVGVDFADAAPATYEAGDDVVFDLSSLSMTGPGDLTDSTVDVSLNGDSLGSFSVTTTLLEALPGFDEAGTASAMVTLPGDLNTGDYELHITGSDTGTEAIVPISVKGRGVGTLRSRTSANVIPGKIEVLTSSLVFVKVSADGETPTGMVEIRDGKALLKTRTLSNGTVSIPTGRLKDTGIYTLSVRYLGDDVVAPSRDTVTVKVVKQSPNLLVRAPKKVDKGSTPRVKAVLKGINAEVTGKVAFRYDGEKVVRTLTNGKAAIRLAKLKQNTRVKVVYRGDGELFKKVIKTKTIKVNKK